MIKELFYYWSPFFWILFVLTHNPIFSEEKSAHSKANENSGVMIELSKEVHYPKTSEILPGSRVQVPLNEKKSLPLTSIDADRLPPGWFLRLDVTLNTAEMKQKVQDFQLRFASEGNIWQQETSSGWRYWIGPLTSEGSRNFLKALQQESFSSALSLKLVKVAQP